MWIGVLWAGLRVAMWIAHVGGKLRHGLLKKSLLYFFVTKQVSTLLADGSPRSFGQVCTGLAWAAGMPVEDAREVRLRQSFRECQSFHFSKCSGKKNSEPFAVGSVQFS